MGGASIAWLVFSGGKEDRTAFQQVTAATMAVLFIPESITLSVHLPLFARPTPCALHGSSRPEEDRPTATTDQCCVHLHLQLITQSDGARIHRRGFFRRKLISRTEAETNHLDLECDLAVSHPPDTAITGALTQSWSRTGRASTSHSHCCQHGRAGNA